MSDTCPAVSTRDPELARIEIAMKRAGKKVRDEARLHGWPIVVVRDGQIVEEIPGPEEDEPGVDAAGSGA